MRRICVESVGGLYRAFTDRLHLSPWAPATVRSISVSNPTGTARAACQQRLLVLSFSFVLVERSGEHEAGFSSSNAFAVARSAGRERAKAGRRLDGRRTVPVARST
jgi:hypothetical protein